MSLTKPKKKEIIDKFAAQPSDTGSASVQVAIITERIQYLSRHLTANPKDHSSQRGLSMLVSKRKHFLSYIEKHDKTEYKKVIKELGLRK